MRMVERVARAISNSEIQDEGGWEAFMPEARAAIEAMREPTEAMMEAGEKYVRTGRIVEVRWHSMIDAALQDSPPITRVEGETQ